MLWYLHNVQGYPLNHKRVYRTYKELELNLRLNRINVLNELIPKYLLYQQPQMRHGQWTLCMLNSVMVLVTVLRRSLMSITVSP